MSDTIEVRYDTEPDGDAPSRWEARWARVVLAGGLALIVILAGCSGDGVSTTTTRTATTTTTTPTTTVAPTSVAPTTAAPTTAATTPPVMVARVFVEAVGTDSSAALDLVADDAILDLAGLREDADLSAWLSWNEAIGWDQTFEGCSASGTDIECGYTFMNPWMEVLGSAPGRESTYTFTITDGVITKATESFNFAQFEFAWDAFIDWLGRAVPAGSDVILDDVGPILTEEAIELWGRYSERFVEAVPNEALGERFVEAFLTFDVADVAALASGLVDLTAIEYLQGFSEATGYALIEPADCTAFRQRSVTCVMVGSDALGEVLGVSFVDQFVIGISGDGFLQSVQWTTKSDPPGVIDDFISWTMTTSPELYEAGGACDRFFAGGPTPGACALALIDEAPAYLDAAGS